MRKLMIIAPALSRSGYGEQARFAIRSLKSAKKYDLYLYNIEWGTSSWISHNDPERGYIDSLIKKTTSLPEDFRADISLQVTIPNEFKVYSPVNIGYTAGIETDRVDDSWVFSSNMLDGLIVPSQHSLSAFEAASKEDSPLTVKPKVVNFPYRSPDSAAPQCESEVLTSLRPNLRKYNFLTVAQVSPRKNIFNLIKWFLKSQGSNDQVSLTLKLHKRNCSTMDKFETISSISSFVSEVAPKKRCTVNLLHGDLSQEDMSHLYNSGAFTHYVTTSHGEGFGLPIFEAAGAGMITIAPGWSGQMDYLAPEGNTKETLFVQVPHSLKEVQPRAVWPGVINAESNWAHISEEDFCKSLKYSIDNYRYCAPRAKKLSTLIKKRFSEKKQSFMFNQMIDQFIKNKEKK